MSTEPAPEVIGELDPVELRVLGCLVEKQAVTPDVYPMTTNALVSAANQKTSREPVTDYNAATIDSTLLRLRERGLIRMVHQQGSRATKHRHVLDEALDVDQGELALLAVLMLRGDQTPGELRSRSERISTFDEVGDVEAVLGRLAERGYVVENERVPGQSARRWSHLLGAAPRDDHGASPTPTSPQPTSPVPPSETSGPAIPVGSDASDHSHAALGEQVAALRRELNALAERFNELCSRLGESDI